MKKIALVLTLMGMVSSPLVLAESSSTPKPETRIVSNAVDIIHTTYGDYDAFAIPMGNRQVDLEKMDFKTTEKQAKKGDKKAQFYLAKFYAMGIHTKQNHQKAIEWYKKSAKQQYADAMNNLAVYYREGHGVEKNSQKAIELWQKASEQNHLTSMVNLGQHLLYSDDKNQQEAGLKWLKQASELNYAPAYAILADIYNTGISVNVDEELSLKYLTKSAELGYAPAQQQLSVQYQMAVLSLISPDERKHYAKYAHQWASRACQNGIEESCGLKAYYDAYPDFADKTTAETALKQSQEECKNGEKAMCEVAELWQKRVDELNQQDTNKQNIKQGK